DLGSDDSDSAFAILGVCPGDSNGDGIVNFADLNAVLAAFGQSGAGIAGDVNGDGAVNFVDLNEVLAAYGADCN
ncbi:MAG: dockerin type I domain-containing protein, partial [Phycisphaerales bacterium]